MGDFSLSMGAALFAQLATSIQHEQQRAVEEAALMLERKVKSIIGHDQGSSGPFPAWPAVASNPNSPLKLSGELQRSYTHIVGDNEAVVGTPSEHAVVHEFGNHREPPRSSLGRALFECEEPIKAMMTRRIGNVVRRL